MVPVLVLVALLFGFAGFLFSSSATAGVYLSSVACLFAIFARLVQADQHHRALLARSERRTEATEER